MTSPLAATLALVPALMLGAQAAAAPAAPAKIAIVYPPQSADEPTRQLGLVMQEMAMALLRGHAQNPELHAKQLNAFANNEGLSFDPAAPAVIERATTNLGGTLGVATRLEPGPKGLTLNGVIVSAGQKPKQVTAVLPMSAAKAANEGARQLYAWAHGTKLAAKTSEHFPPMSESDDAVRAYARCYATLVKQPMGIDNPSILDSEAVKTAVTACREAVAADPKWPTPKAALALALAIDGSDAEAATLVADLKDDGDILPLYWIARFWLVTRYQSPDAGKAVLIEATGFRPGFGLAEMYLCELLLTLGQNEPGLKLCEAALASMPKAVFPELRVGKALSRLGRHDEAIARTKAAGARDPKSREAKLQLGSRYIDAGRLEEAIGVLEPLVQEANVRGETLLRLGYAYEETGQLDKALPMYERTITVATGPSEWRTKGRAYYDVAVIRAKAKEKDKATEALRQAWATGFRVRNFHPALADIAKTLDAENLRRPADAGAMSLVTPPREVSLFPVDAFGDIDASPRKQAPADFIKVKF